MVGKNVDVENVEVCHFVSMEKKELVVGNVEVAKYVSMESEASM